MPWDVSFCLFSSKPSFALLSEAIRDTHWKMRSMELTGYEVHSNTVNASSTGLASDLVLDLGRLHASAGEEAVFKLTYAVRRWKRSEYSTCSQATDVSQTIFFGPHSSLTGGACGKSVSAIYNVGSSKLYTDKRTLAPNTTQVVDEIEELIHLWKLEKVFGFGPFGAYDDSNPCNIEQCFLFYIRDIRKLLNPNGEISDYDALNAATLSSTQYRILRDNSVIFYNDKFCNGSLEKFKNSLQSKAQSF